MNFLRFGTASRRTATTYAAVLLLFTLLVGGSLWLGLSAIEHHVSSVAEQRGRIVFQLLEGLRQWAVIHGDAAGHGTGGGVLAEDAATGGNGPPAQEGAAGFNPHRIGRQVIEGIGRFDVSFHISSLDPVNPGNLPDAWERQALMAFQDGREELLSLTDQPAGERLFRYMAPVKMGESCLPCHGGEDRQAGDIRGGLSVNMAADPLFSSHDGERAALIGSHAFILLLGWAVLLALMRLHQRHNETLEQGQQRLEGVVEERTRALRESSRQLLNTIAAAPSPIMIHAEDGTLVTVNASWVNITGHARDEFATMEEWGRRALAADRTAPFLRQIAAVFDNEGPQHVGEFIVHTAFGWERVWDFNAARIGRLPDGRAVAVSMVNDITERWWSEFQLRRERDLNASLAEVANYAQQKAVGGVETANLLFTRARELTEATEGYVAQVDQQSGEIVSYVHSDGMRPFSQRQERGYIVFPPPEEGVFRHLGGRALQTGQGYFVNVVTGSDSATAQDALQRLNNLLSAPVVSGTLLLGQIVLANAPSGFSAHHLDAVKQLADIYALALMREQYEQQLRQSAQDYRNLFDNASDGIIIHDLQGRILQVNPTWCLCLGYSEEEMLHKTLREIKPPEQDAFFQQRIDTIIENGRLVYETVHVTRGGERIQVEVSSRLIGFRRQPAILSICRDIRERKRAAAALEESERRLQEIAAAVGEAIYVLDPQGRITFVNAAACKLLGWPEEALLGERAHQRFHTGRDSAAADACPILAAMRQGRRIDQLEQVFYHSQGHAVPVLVGASPILRNGGIKGIVVAFHDISRFKQERERLEEALRQAELANVAKSQFLANMSHEIRTPMNAIIGMTGLLAESGLNTKQSQWVDKVRCAVHSLLGIINDILDLSKLESGGNIAIAQRPFSLHDLVESVTATLGSLAGRKGLALTVQLDASLAPCYLGDFERIQQILINLVGNALKFTESGSVSISIWEVENNQLCFAVADTGIGIAADKLEEIFKPFTQADGSTTRKYGGTGLGTTISRHLVALMGGRIWVESPGPGQGSTFYFTLGLPEAHGVIDCQRRAHVLTGRIDSARPLTILLAEDVETNRAVILERFAQSAHRIVVARNGAEALETFAQQPVDLILMDVNMPVMDGLEATREIRAIEAREGRDGTPIIALTAHAMAGDEKRCLESGMNGYVSKPVDFNVLYEVINGLLAKAGRGVAPVVLPPPRTAPHSAAAGLPGIDGDAVKQRWTSPQSHAKALDGFLAEHRQSPAELRQLVAAADYAGAEALAHALKGAAATLAATRVAHAAAALDAQLKEAVADLDGVRMGEMKQSIGQLESALAELEGGGEALPEAVAEAPREAPPPRIPEGMTREDLSQGLLHMLHTLDRGDQIAAAGQAHQLQERGFYALERIIHDVELFDLQGAAGRLRELIIKLGNSD